MGMKVDKARAEAAITEFLRALGHDEAALGETPARVTAAYADELLSGYSEDLKELILEGSETAAGVPDPVVLDGISAATVCPHHLLVASGKALVAYVPGERVLGLGTISRLVNACSRRLVLQEQIAQSVTEALMQYAGAKGAFCRLTLHHACLQTRGAHEPDAEAVTWSGLGSLSDPTSLEAVLGRSLRGSASRAASAAPTSDLSDES